MKKKLITLFLAICMICTLLPFGAFAEDEEAPTSGTCGDNATWTYKDGVLTISGTGEMERCAWGYDDWSYGRINSVVINKGITSIGDYAFADTYYNLTSVTIPNSVTSIGDYAFSYCGSLTSITIPNSVKSIGSNAFCDCGRLKEITIPDSVKSIGECAFINCNNLAKVTISNGVTNIGLAAFMNCTSLTSVTIPDSVTSIGEEAFSYCSSLKEITIPDSVKSIEWGAFHDCNSLTKVTILGKLTSIENATFNNCTNLKEINIPESVTSIGDRAFYECDSLKEITIPDSVTSIDNGAFAFCSSLKEITIPDSVTSIGSGAFAYCSSLKDITIPCKVKSIKVSTVANCDKLKSVTIPYSVKSIEDGAFAECKSLTDIYYLETETQWNKIKIGANDCEYLLDAKMHYSDHTWDSGKNTEAASCAADGVKTYTCKVCGETKTEPISALGHKTELKNTKEATCTAKGYTGDKVCKNCGKTIEKGKDVAALGHSWDAGKITTKATCTEKGAKTYTCAVCDATKTESIAALGHKTELKNTKEATCTAKGYTGDKVCKTCGKTIEKGKDVAALGHSWDAGKITTKATCTEKGVKTYTCKTCSATKSESIAAISHNYKNGKCAVCGAKDPNYKPVTNNPFVDIKKADYYYEPVLWAYYHDPQITTGVDKTHFAPNNNCTRGQIVAFLWRACGCPEVKTRNNPFKDVKSSDYYYKAVLWAVENGITHGVDQTHFAPNNTCTRAESVTFMWRYEGKPEVKSTKNPFTDLQLSDYYGKAVLWAVGKNITNGVDKTHFAPYNTCTRGQIVTFLYRDMK